MESTKHESTTETQSSKGGVSSRLPWTIEEMRYLWDSLSANPYGYGRYVLAAEMQNKKFESKRTPAACRAMDRRMLWRP